MLLLDRYLLRQFIQTLGIFFCSLTGLYVIIDAFGNLEEFVAYADKHGGLLSIMGEYYGYRMLSFFDLTSSTLTLISSMFTLTWFQRHNELTAIMAAGVPKLRIIKPLIVAVGVVSLVAAANREIVIPLVREKFSRNAQDLLGDVGKVLQPRYDNKTDVLLAGRKTLALTQQIQEPVFRLPPALDRYGGQIAGENAFYQAPTDGRPGGYLITGVTQPKGLEARPSLAANGELVVLTPQDFDWLKPDECFVASEVTFEQLVGASSWRQYSSTFELIMGLRNRGLDVGADVRVAIHARIVQPLLDMTLLFLGLPLVLGRDNRNMFLAIALCLLVVIGFMLVVIGSQALGKAYLASPALAAWLPLMIFVPLAAAWSDPLLE